MAGLLFVFQMLALSYCQVSIQLGVVLEDRHSRKRLDDLEDLLDLGLHVDEQSLAPPLFELLPRHGKHAQAGAADELQLAKSNTRCLTGRHARRVALQFGRRGGVEAAREFNGDGARVFVAGGFEGQDFEWHMCISVVAGRILRLDSIT